MFSVSSLYLLANIKHFMKLRMGNAKLNFVELERAGGPAAAVIASTDTADKITAAAANFPVLLT